MPQVTIYKPGCSPRRYNFLDPWDRKIRLGRAIDNDIIIASPSVSNYHAEIVREQGAYVLRDLGSTNGIKCDGVRRNAIGLPSSGRITLGEVELGFSEPSAAEMIRPATTATNAPRPSIQNAAPPRSSGSGSAILRWLAFFPVVLVLINLVYLVTGWAAWKLPWWGIIIAYAAVGIPVGLAGFISVLTVAQRRAGTTVFIALLVLGELAKLDDFRAWPGHFIFWRMVADALMIHGALSAMRLSVNECHSVTS